MNKTWNIAYYVLNILLSAVMLSGAYADLTQSPQLVMGSYIAYSKRRQLIAMPS